MEARVVLGGSAARETDDEEDLDGDEEENEEDEGMMPLLPLVMAEGHDWSVYYARLPRRGEVPVLGPRRMGSMVGLKGTYQVLMGLRVLCR